MVYIDLLCDLTEWITFPPGHFHIFDLSVMYWRGDKYWLGKILEHPEIMTQGETLEELEENIKEAYLLMAMDEVPEKYETKEIVLWNAKALCSNWKRKGVFY